MGEKGNNNNSKSIIKDEKENGINRGEEENVMKKFKNANLFCKKRRERAF